MLATLLAIAGGSDITLVIALLATVTLAASIVFMLFLAVAPVVSETWEQRLGAVPSGDDYGLEADQAD